MQQENKQQTEEEKKINVHVYKLYNTVDSMFYIGSTSQPLANRIAVHRCFSRKGRQSVLYTHMRNIGPRNWRIQSLQSIEYRPARQPDWKYQARVHEQRYIDIHKPPLNMRRSYMTPHLRVEWRRQYYIRNKSRILEVRYKPCTLCHPTRKFAYSHFKSLGHLRAVAAAQPRQDNVANDLPQTL